MNGYINECNYKNGWMLNIPPSYQKVNKITNNKKTTKNEKGLEKLCRNPTLKEVWGRHSHSQKQDLGVLWDSQNFIIQ
jgi:hypothetical protein